MMDDFEAEVERLNSQLAEKIQFITELKGKLRQTETKLQQINRNQSKENEKKQR